MRNLLSTAVIATALALGVPSNGAEAVRLAGSPATAAAPAALDAGPSQFVPAAPSPGMAWILALGFLGLVILRRTQ